MPILFSVLVFLALLCVLCFCVIAIVGIVAVTLEQNRRKQENLQEQEASIFSPSATRRRVSDNSEVLPE